MIIQISFVAILIIAGYFVSLYMDYSKRLTRMIDNDYEKHWEKEIRTKDKI